MDEPSLVMRIDLTVSHRPRRWHLQLRDRLRRAGHETGLVIDESAPQLEGLEALAAWEARIYRATPGGGESAPVDVHPEARGTAADLDIDLTGRSELPAGAGRRRLVPFFDAQAGIAALVAPLLEGRAPEMVVALCEGEAIQPLVAGMPALEEPHRVIRSLDRACARLCDLIVDAVARLHAGLPGLPAPRAFGSSSRLGPFDFASAGLRQLAGRLRLRLQRIASGGHEWRVAWRQAGPETLIGATRAWPRSPYMVLPDDGARYYADPFLFGHEGRTWLFCEEYPFATGRGLLSVVEMGPQGPLGTPRPFLEEACHLSYPLVFAHEGAAYMIPETSARGTVELWRAERLPDRWRKVATLIENVHLADATLVQHAGRWWLFAAMEAEGQSSWDMLGLYVAERLEGPWRPHPGNPVAIDSRSARPAGRMWADAAGLWRPVQDCSAGYGSRLGLARIERLDPEGFAQSVVVSLSPPEAWRARGAHTLDAGHGFEVIDVLAPPSLQLAAAKV